MRQRRPASADRDPGPGGLGVGTIVGDGALPPEINHGSKDVAVNLLPYLGQGATLVSGPAGRPLAFMDRRLFAVLVFTLRDNVILKIEAPWTPRPRYPDN